MEIKLGDVFRFQYTYQPGERDRYWCFDGQLVATAHNGGIMLVDTYWCTSGSNRQFTQEEAEAKGTLKLVCNLNEVEEIKDGTFYYDEKDVFDLSYQHNCYKRFMKRKGAPRSRDAMRAHLQGLIQKARADVSHAVSRCEFLAQSIHALDGASDLEKVWL